jgi:hypothetical protein
MAIDTIAFPTPARQPRKPAKAPALTPAERAKRYRQRKKANPAPERKPDLDLITAPVTDDFDPWHPAEPEAPVTASPVTTVTAPATSDAQKRSGDPKEHTRSFSPARVFLAAVALSLAMVGVTINATFAGSLGSSALAGGLFTALGLGADCAALALPSRWRPRCGRRISESVRALRAASW